MEQRPSIVVKTSSNSMACSLLGYFRRSCRPHSSSCGGDNAFLNYPFIHHAHLLPAGFRARHNDEFHSCRMGVHATKHTNGYRVQALPGRRVCLPDPGSHRDRHGLPGYLECSLNQFHTDRDLQRRHREPAISTLCFCHPNRNNSGTAGGSQRRHT